MSRSAKGTASGWLCRTWFVNIGDLVQASIRTAAWSILSLAIWALVGCIVERETEISEAPVQTRDGQLSLVDLTDQFALEFPTFAERFGADVLLPREAMPLGADALDAATRAALVAAASEWALSAGYLPCAFEMAVRLLRDPSGNFGAYISPSVRDGSIAPETVIFFGRGSLEVVEECRYHSPCK